jgi:hypothetical protein
MFLTFSPATYEHFKQAMIDMFVDSPTSQLYGELRSVKEGKGLVTEQQMKLYNRTSAGKKGKTCKLVINMYNTPSTMLVNGSTVKLFMANHLPALEKLVARKIQDQPHLDDQLYAILSSSESGCVRTDPHTSAEISNNAYRSRAHSNQDGESAHIDIFNAVREHSRSHSSQDGNSARRDISSDVHSDHAHQTLSYCN